MRPGRTAFARSPTQKAENTSGKRGRGGGIGAAALCGGGGQGDALIVRVPKA